MSRGPAALTPDYATSTQSLVADRHGATEDGSLRRAATSVSARSRVPGATTAGVSESSLTGFKSTTHSPDDHGMRYVDLLDRTGSDSSSASAASSIFSAAHNMSYTGRNPSLHAYPLDQHRFIATAQAAQPSLSDACA
jgi:hypothetical protein